MNYNPTFFDRLPATGVLKARKGIQPYVFTEEIAIGIDVALATERPLLISGKPGCWKSQLAQAVAEVQGWNFLSRTITSRTRLEELTVEMDYLRRLNDAQVRGDSSSLKPDKAYYKPGIFWWAFDPETAIDQLRQMTDAENLKKSVGFPGSEKLNAGGVVLLIDEIDKAEPDLPNDLLEPLDRKSFSLPDGRKIEAKDGLKRLTLITTNGERELPQAFLRRCVTLELGEPDKKALIRIASFHFPEGNTDRIEAIAGRIITFREEASNQRRRPPGTGEFLDAIRACEALKIEVSDNPKSEWMKINNAILQKDRQT